MSTAHWITSTADKYREYLNEESTKLHKDDLLARVERGRRERIANEGKDAGRKLWCALQTQLRTDAAAFNEVLKVTVLRTADRGNGTFDVTAGDPGTGQKIVTLSYTPDTTELSWHVHGGVVGTRMEVGIEPRPNDLQMNTNPLLFTTGSSYLTTEAISQRIIQSLLP